MSKEMQLFHGSASIIEHPKVIISGFYKDFGDGFYCANPLKVVSEWVEEYNLQEGNFDILDVDKELVERPPTPLQMGKVHKRLILNTLQSNEDYIQGLIRVYNAEICETIDNYNCSAYYEPSPVIARSYYNGYF